MTGTVKWFSDAKGYGFITPDEGDTGDVFVHYSDIEMRGYRSLAPAQRVSFEVGDDGKGAKAVCVRMEARG